MFKLKSIVPESISKKFRFGTLSFIFIILYVNIFQLVFGPENSIVGVIFVIMMSASMVRDLTATPIRHLCIQSLVLVWMAVAAFLVNTLNPAASFVINLITLVIILYAFTYEYSNHMYFPYILSYLFLIYITPINDVHLLPKRLLGMLVGAVSIILYQWFMGRNRIHQTAKGVLSEIIDNICLFISFLLGETKEKPDLSETSHKLWLLSHIVYERRKKILCVSDSGFSMIAMGRSLEQILITLHELPATLSEQEKNLLNTVSKELKTFRSFLQNEISILPSLDTAQFSISENKPVADLLYKLLSYTHQRLIHMADSPTKPQYRKSGLSLKIRLQAALDISPIRVIYSLRVALLLSCATLIVQSLNLPHGKWLLFTLASVSLPYADDIPLKIKKRLLATIIGGLAAVVIYTLIPSPIGRTAAMMLSGYLSFYFNDYTATFACSTIGALGGAVFMNAFGFTAIGQIFLIRIGYILAGIAIAFAANCYIFPFTRSTATEQLWEKYKTIAELLTKVCGNAQTDPQLYYHLVIQAHLLEEKISNNALLEGWEDFPSLLTKCRKQIRRAHMAGSLKQNSTP